MNWCKYRKCMYAVFLAIIILWLLLQIGYLRSWLEIGASGSANCPKYTNILPVSHNLQHEMVILKQQVARLRKHISANSPYNNTVHLDTVLWPSMPIIYAITPTYYRVTQKAELTRLMQTFMLVPNFHWIIIEDSVNKTSLVDSLLKNSGLIYTHLNIATPSDYKMSEKDPNWLKPKGVLQRNLGISWLRQTFRQGSSIGVVFFADDDNAYDLELFEEMRFTNTVSVWPVGLVGGLMVERPKIRNKQVVGWLTAWKPSRPFALDMAGFAVNLALLLNHPKALFNLTAPRGYQESSLLQQLVSLEQLEARADHCTKVFVWHTRTEKVKLKAEEILHKQGKRSNAGIEV